jgi:hypothetical protein
MTNGTNTLVNAKVEFPPPPPSPSPPNYNSNMSMFLYFFNNPYWFNTAVVRTYEFQPNNYNPSSFDFSTAIVTDGYPNYTVLTGANLNWSQQSGTYYVVWTQFNTQTQSPIGGYPDLHMIISDTPKSPGPVPAYAHQPGTGHWYWAGTITATTATP